QDHAVVGVEPFTVSDPSASWNLLKNLSFSDFDELLNEGKGYAVISSNGFTYIASQRAQKENPNWADLQIVFKFQRRYLNDLGCTVALGRPYSRGTLRYNTSATSMLDDHLPISDPRYYTHPYDLERVIEGIEFCVKVFEETEAFKKIGAKFSLKPIEECTDTVFRSKDYWACYAQYRTTSLWHTSGSCRMGKPNDRDRSVVDSKLRVHGVKKLRIVDASIFPRIPNANIAAAVIVTAEKISDSLIEDYTLMSKEKIDIGD
ncbi:unnamed protein product, partial [Allacma fusca]